jgi:hypothetical protein
VLLLVVNLHIFSIPVVAADNETGQTITEDKKIPCRGLKPFNDIDELLYQFYINLDSDCLFKMPLEELEAIWQINIVSNAKRDPEYLKKIKERSDVKKEYNEAFYVAAYHDKDGDLTEFRISITESYLNLYGTLFINGHFSKLLPRPLKTFRQGVPKYCKPSPNNPVDSTSSRENFVYYWLNSDQTRLIYLEDRCNVTGISIMNSVLPFAKKAE